jgi:hypothetical protein
VNIYNFHTADIEFLLNHIFHAGIHCNLLHNAGVIFFVNTIMKNSFPILLISSLILISIACRKKKETAETRSFYMGVTPWPADFTEQEVNNSYDFINNHCDIVSHHFDDGIPYEEAFANLPMPLRFQQEVQTRKTKTAAGKKVFLSVSALNLNRKEKADYYSNTVVTDSIKNYWKQLPVNHTKIVTAYVNYISRLIDEFMPVYVNYGVESNNGLWNPAEFALYKDFVSKVYSQLKIKYPGIPFFISFIVDETTAGYNYASQLIPYSDFVGLSAYPYVVVSSSATGNTDPKNFPANFFTKFINLAPSKPLAFAETGYIAENLVIPSFSLNKQGNEAWQKDYLEMICKLCNERKAKLLIWFCHKDYDAGDNTLRSLGLYQDLFGLWEDIGLKDETGRERPAYQSWLQWMQRKNIE